MKSFEAQVKSMKGKVVWMASYPKSGNTWFRCVLSALATGKVDINRINTDGIFSNRALFDFITEIDGRLLDEEEVKIRMSTVFQYHLTHAQKLEFTKVHDAYSLDQNGKPIFPKEVTQKAIYLVRNPLDVVASFANHNASTIDQTIKLMNKKNGYLARQKNGLNINNQLPQLMYDWSGHVKSWLDQKEIDVIIMRYEDTKKDAVKNYYRVLKEVGIKLTKKKIKEAVDLAKFDRLKSMEKESGFREKNIKSESFFRSGKSGGYKKELTKEQIQIILDHHGEVMERLGYETNV